jgi:hypothetical protein
MVMGGVRFAGFAGRRSGWYRVGTVVAVAALVSAGVVSSAAARVAPNAWVQQGGLTAADAAVDDSFGSAVDISRDGTTAIVGASGKSGNAGAVYVFVNNGSTWVQQGELTASDAASSDGFGESVAVSLDGSSVVIGAPLKTVGGFANTGAAYVFTRSGTTWSQKAELFASPVGRGSYFGSSVAIQSVGTTVAVGAPYKSVSGHRRAGAAFVYKRTPTGWTQSGMLTASDASDGDRFGSKVIVKESLVLASAPFHTNANGSTGAVYVFDGAGGTYVQKTVLTASDGQAGDHFGLAMDLSLATLVVGTPDHVVGSHRVGAAYVFTHSDTTGIWTQRARLAPTAGTNADNFGAAVAISSASIAVGNPNHKVGSNAFQGVVDVFTGGGTTWTQQAELSASDGAPYEYFGDRVAVYPTSVMVGEPLYDAGAISGAGRVDVFASS